MKHPYSHDGRLSDVMALIQVLALDDSAHRSEEGLKNELQGKPSSAESWENLAKQHLEFFRVRKSGTHTVSLISRHVLPEGERNLPPELIGQLLEAAIQLHDRELERKFHWKIYIPIIVVVTAGIFTLVGAYIKEPASPETTHNKSINYAPSAPDALKARAGY